MLSWIFNRPQIFSYSSFIKLQKYLYFSDKESCITWLKKFLIDDKDPLKLFLENDARVATFAEAISGKGKDKNIVCYITISTGLGGGLVINKEIYNGSNNLGAYFARMILDGEHTSNNLISGTALLEQSREKINKNMKNTLEVFELEKNNNPIAKEIISNFKRK